MTIIKDLLDELEKYDDAMPVTLDGEGNLAFDSWRGIYSEASLVSDSSTHLGYDIYQNTEHGFAYTDARQGETVEGANTVGELKAVIKKLLDGGHLQGYKGGWYQMSELTDLHADEYGTASGRIIVSVTEQQGTVLITSAEPLGV